MILFQVHNIRKTGPFMALWTDPTDQKLAKTRGKVIMFKPENNKQEYYCSEVRENMMRIN